MKYVVAEVDEIPPGGRKIVEVARRSIGIFNLDGQYFALRNHCPHQGAPLCLGKIWGRVSSTRPGEFDWDSGGEIITCPHHGWEFSIRTGQSWCDPDRLKTSTYAVAVESGAELAEDGSLAADGRVKGPFQAQTVPVTVDGRYLVLDLT